MTFDPLNPSWHKKLRHYIHYRWNQSKYNKDYDPFISDCVCCCCKCEEH